MTRVLVRRLASPARWFDLELLFDKYCSQLSELFWDGLKAFSNAYCHLFMGSISPENLSEGAGMYSEAVLEKTGAPNNCMVFLDGTVLGNLRPKESAEQLVMYNGHKQKYALR